MTLIELLVASGIGLAVMAMVFSSTMANRRLYEIDIVRTRLNQNLRGALNYLGADVRQSGERLPTGFPAVEIIDGADGAPDELILRRNVLDEVIAVCQTIPAGSSDTNISMTGGAGASPACVYGSQAASLAAFQNRRLDEGGTSKLYIYNFATQLGEFIDHTGESDSGVSMSIQRTGTALVNQYDAEAAAVYALVEWRYRLDTVTDPDGLLQVIENGDTSNPQNITFGVRDMQIVAILNDDSQQTTFGIGDSWSLLKAVEITVSGEERTKATVINSVFSSRFFPRNVLSL